MRLDPDRRWEEAGLEGAPEYAGLVTFSGLAYTEDLEELDRCDVAIVGAPMDELATDRSGARGGPRAIRLASAIHGPHLEAGVDWSEELDAVDFGDAPVVPSDPRGSHRAIEALVARVRQAGALPVLLGGDHSVTEPSLRACAGGEPLGLIHFDAHTDTAAELWGVENTHGSPMYRLVEQGHVDPRRYVQIGLRGYWPGDREFAWQRERGITSMFMHEVREAGIEATIDRALAAVGEGPAYLSVDIDVLEPGLAPGTGTPEPGGMSPGDLLDASRRLAEGADLVGADLVEVLPAHAGPVDVTALTAGRVVTEILTGVALRRRRGGSH